VSPWTTGGYVYTGASDHTSVLQFLEAVTGVEVPNITAWRRSTFGDLTDVFQAPATTPAPPALPSTTTALAQAEYAQANYPAPTPPGAVAVRAHPGVRHPARGRLRPHGPGRAVALRAVVRLRARSPGDFQALRAPSMTCVLPEM
jgi:phospholipase C